MRDGFDNWTERLCAYGQLAFFIAAANVRYWVRGLR